jgi:Flp pilus assembly pilin Flp
MGLVFRLSEVTMNGMEIFRRMLSDKRGATASEYVVMITLILLVVFATVVVLGLQVEEAFNTFVSMLTS